MNTCQIITDLDQIWIQIGNIQEESFGRVCWMCELACENTGENQKGEW